MALKEFRASGADVILVQEAHFRAGSSLKFASKHFLLSYLAFDPSEKAGVAVLPPPDQVYPLRPPWSLYSFTRHLLV